MKHILSIILLAVALLGGATRIVILSDVHVTPGNPNDSMLRVAVDEINAMEGVDLVVMNGDLTNEGSDEQLRNVKATLDLIQQPLYVIPGNHENNWSQSATKTFIDLWGDDRFLCVTDSLVITGTNCGPFMKMGDGHVKQEDLHWLHRVLSENVKDGRKVVSFNHYALNSDLDNYLDYAAILEKYPTLVHINGHYHRYEPYHCGRIPGMMVRALETRDHTWGYTILDILPDSLVFSQKLLGEEPTRVHAICHPEGDSAMKEGSLSPVARPTDNIKEGPQSQVTRQVEPLHVDSASVFTRLGFTPTEVLFGTSLGQIKALDKVTGEQKWVVTTDASVFSRPVYVDGLVAAPTADHRLLWIKDGEIVRETPSEGPYVADGLAVADTLYQGGYKKMEKWTRGGQLIWRYDSINNYCQAAPVLVGDNLIFGAWDTYLRCLDARTGQLRWKWSNGKSANMLGPGNVVPVVYDGKVVIVAPDRYMTAIDLATGQTLWRDNSHRYRESLGRSEDGRVAYAKTMDGELVAVDLTAPEFRELWTVDMGLGYEHAPCIVAESDGVIYAGSRRGLVVKVVKDGACETLNLGVSEVNGIDIDPWDGSVWVSLVEGRIYRLTQK
ncbi:MAG: PQQ-binding-like beta-propeller repeat protein [Bacteroidales bacterium]|nr:PQQ-binding-like beta-propeller repeat protein [Bacteroidales bacterium]MCD8393916.1 PQQ-binding-like beta-propeller repeat protein [Bacteroidales bacterium]